MKLMKSISMWGLTTAMFLGMVVPAHGAIYSEGRPLIETMDVAGSGEYNEWNGNAAEAAFRHPGAILVLADGSLLVSDTENHRIRAVRNGHTAVYAGTEVSVLTGEDRLPLGAYADGAAGVSYFSSPIGLASDGKGNVYVADQGNHAVRKISPDGNVTTIAGNGVLGDADGKGSEASFHTPSDVAVDAAGNVYVADTLNHAIRKVDPAGNVTTLNALSERIVEVFDGVVEATGDYRDGPLAEALFNEPSGLALDSKGNLYVSDTGNQRIRYIDFHTDIVTTVAGGGELLAGQMYVSGAYRDGAAEEARFFSPYGLAVDEGGGLYIADSLNHAIRYLKDGLVTTAVGSAGEYGSANGYEKQAALYRPSDIALDRDGNLYIADTLNNKIRKVSFYELPSGWEAGSGDIRVLHNQKEIVFDTAPEMHKGRIMLPVRAIAEALEYSLKFVDQDTVTLSGPRGDAVTLSVGSIEAHLTQDDQTALQMDVAPYIKDGRIYVPVRFIAEGLGATVNWHADTKTVLLRE